ncbi:phosphate signaling complex protein PhoU [Halalkalirubrum salinum]|uniref:phosphate signaling complex protein PhoU n=1 Tax=Halalkalirubrum salinum TaxID=2563889 RepID=UPI0010FBA5BE|nr:phosphate signaling complex protein PhoU [Halalkalirubrum salinum]
MPRNEYQADLEALRDDVLYMSEVVAERLRDGLDALERKDEALARQVIEGDTEVNDMYLELEQDCTNLIALQQPVASDLRFIAASFNIITDLERIGDLATNLGEYATEAEQDVFPDVDIQLIGEKTLDMLDRAMTAYAGDRPQICYEVAKTDDELDELCEAASEIVVRDLIDTERAESEDITTLMADVSRLSLTIRDLERVGDHTVNIAARTLYMIENNDELIY